MTPPAQTAAVKLTPKTLAWLIYLRDNGPAICKGRGNTGYRCRVAGLTEWDFRDPQTKEPVSAKDAEDRFGVYWYAKVLFPDEERLTDAGRSLLSQTEGEAP